MLIKQVPHSFWCADVLYYFKINDRFISEVKFWVAAKESEKECLFDREKRKSETKCERLNESKWTVNGMKRKHDSACIVFWKFLIILLCGVYVCVCMLWMGSQLLVVYVRLYLHVYLLVLYGCQGRLSDVSERDSLSLSYRYCNNKFENYYTHTRSTLSSSSLSFVLLSLLPRTSIELRVMCVYFVCPRRLNSYTHSFALDIYYDYY